MSKTRPNEQAPEAPLPDPAPELPAALEMPSEGGSWIRMPDGSLEKEGNT